MLLPILIRYGSEGRAIYGDLPQSDPSRRTPCVVTVKVQVIGKILCGDLGSPRLYQPAGSCRQPARAGSPLVPAGTYRDRLRRARAGTSGHAGRYDSESARSAGLYNHYADPASATAAGQRPRQWQSNFEKPGPWAAGHGACQRHAGGAGRGLPGTECST